MSLSRAALRIACLLTAVGFGFVAWAVHVGVERGLWGFQPVLILTAVLFASSVFWRNALRLGNSSALGLASVGAVWSLSEPGGGSVPPPSSVIAVLVLSCIGVVGSSSRIGTSVPDLIAGSVTVAALAGWTAMVGRGWLEVGIYSAVVLGALVAGRYTRSEPRVRAALSAGGSPEAVR